MKNLVKFVQNFNALNGLWNRGDMIIVGVSGGPDSMCLLDVLAKIAKKEDLTIVVAHVNYGLRGESSEGDESLVKKTAHQYGFACEVKKCNDGMRGSEAHWRNIRYNFFSQLQKKYRANVVAVGHTKNDQVETFLLRLLRGSGLKGLSAMQFKNEKKVIRPLLRVDRVDVLDYCDQNKISYRIDVSNDNNDFTRNKVRNHLIPLLKNEYNIQIVEVLARTALTLTEDYDYLSKSITPFWQYDADHKLITFEAEVFNVEHISVQRMALRQMISMLQGATIDIEKGFIDELQKAIRSSKGKNQEIIGKDLKMHKKGDKVELACREEF